MKKIYYAALLFIVSFTDCRKNESVFSASEKNGATLLSQNDSFIALCDALKHFDAAYHRCVYNDKDDDQQQAIDGLIGKLDNGPDDLSFQKLADVCHFKSVAGLKQCITQVDQSLAKLRCGYDLAKRKVLNDALKLYAKNKIDNYPTLTHQPYSPWRDFVTTYFAEFDYYVYEYDFPNEKHLYDPDRIERIALIHIEN